MLPLRGVPSLCRVLPLPRGSCIGPFKWALKRERIFALKGGFEKFKPQTGI